LFLISFF